MSIAADSDLSEFCGWVHSRIERALDFVETNTLTPQDELDILSDIIESVKLLRELAPTRRAAPLALVQAPPWQS